AGPDAGGDERRPAAGDAAGLLAEGGRRPGGRRREAVLPGRYLLPARGRPPVGAVRPRRRTASAPVRHPAPAADAVGRLGAAGRRLLRPVALRHPGGVQEPRGVGRLLPLLVLVRPHPPAAAERPRPGGDAADRGAAGLAGDDVRGGRLGRGGQPGSGPGVPPALYPLLGPVGLGACDSAGGWRGGGVASAWA